MTEKTSSFLKQSLCALLIILLLIVPSLLPIWVFYARYWAGMLPIILILLAIGIVRIYRAPSMAQKILAVCIVTAVLAIPLKTWAEGKALLAEECIKHFREAAHLAETESSPTAVFCAFGDARTLFQFYSKRPVQILKNVADLRVFLKNHADVTCFVSPNIERSTGAHDQDILKAFRQIAREKRVGQVTVFFINHLEIP